MSWHVTGVEVFDAIDNSWEIVRWSEDLRCFEFNKNNNDNNDDDDNNNNNNNIFFSKSKKHALLNSSQIEN